MLTAEDRHSDELFWKTLNTIICNILYMKTVTLRDDVYRKLLSLKGDRSFSDVIDDLIRRDVERRVSKIIEVSISAGSPEEMERMIREIREGFKVRI